MPTQISLEFTCTDTLCNTCINKNVPRLVYLMHFTLSNFSCTAVAKEKKQEAQGSHFRKIMVALFTLFET